VVGARDDASVVDGALRRKGINIRAVKSAHPKYETEALKNCCLERKVGKQKIDELLESAKKENIKGKTKTR